MFGRVSLGDRQLVAEKALAGIFERIEHLESTPPPQADLDPLHASLLALRTDVGDMVRSYEAQQKRLDDIEEQARDFTIALAEGIERYGRAERRIKATVQRARKELAARGYEDPGLEAEGNELRDIDGSGSDGSRVLPLRPTVEEPVPTPSSVRGVSVEELQRGRGWR